MGSTATATLRPYRPALSLAAGDLLVIVATIVYGELDHGINPLEEPMLVLDTMIPFLLGWVVLAALLGVYSERARADRRWSLRVTAAAWLGAANVGLILRGSDLFHGNTLWPFPLVITGTVLVGLLVWRAVYAYVGSQTE